MNFQLKFAWSDLVQGLKRLWLFCACLIFGVCLVMAAASLYQMLDRVLLSDTRALMGGDVEIESSEPIEQAVLDWLASTGDISLTRELDTMMSTQGDEFALVELLSIDNAYPLYGELTLQPEQNLSSALANDEGQWGVAVDPILAERSQLRVGDTVYIGDLELVIRALVLAQPDRRLNANWRGAPVLISEEAMNASGLLRPGSRVEYEYRIRTSEKVDTWEDNFIAQFPDTDWEIQTFKDRSRRIAERLSQIASGLLIVAFSTLFIGGLGIFNSISVYLQSKRETIATLKACGLRDAKIGQIFVVQIAILASVSGFIGVLFGSGLALIGSQVLSQDLPLVLQASDTIVAAFSAWFFGIVTAFTFALPALGRALQVDVAHLFRANNISGNTISVHWRIASYGFAIMLAILVLFAIPNVLFGLAFLVTVIICLSFFEVVVRGLRWVSRTMEQRQWLLRHAATRLALANMHRPGTPLRITLLSLGTALTLLVACTVIVFSLLRLVETTIPEESPALVLYDVLSEQKEGLHKAASQYDSVNKLTLSPNVRARVSAINGTPIRELGNDDVNWQNQARDEHKLSYLSGNIDGIKIVDGAIWDDSFSANSLANPNIDFAFIMEDREAQQMRLSPGDIVQFSLVGIERTGLLTGIYSQQGIQTRFWFEAIFSDGALDDFINAYVGTIYMDDEEALALQTQLARTYPNIITVRTKDLIDSASDLLNKGTSGLSVISAISLLVSLMVLASVMAAGRSKQSYHAIILYCIGARISYIRRAIIIEYSLLATVVSLFSIILGLIIATLVLQVRLKVFAWDIYWMGMAVACISSVIVFSLGALYLFQKLKIQPAQLLKESS
ncbi:ABC transporter permease [Glaciecola petra]|uniref:ABC transporter permease n=1 Tax=Glaciecola petra TaxID=3075602 RepID=A0ABU2ZQV3_9ALTE|nr:FtsX-like permease family protein [Aestuariibacter sp. P117]MDT0595007.1 ABC transporter permease [Aestuariibacter sp. P117]